MWSAAISLLWLSAIAEDVCARHVYNDNNGVQVYANTLRETLAAPVQYSFIHIHKEPRNFTKHLHQIDVLLNEMNTALQARVSTPEFKEIIEDFATFVDKTVPLVKLEGARIKEINKALHLQATPDHDLMEWPKLLRKWADLRPKRALGAVVGLIGGGIGSLIAFGLGVHSTSEVSKLHHSVKTLEENQEKIIVSLKEQSTLIDKSFATVQTQFSEVFHNMSVLKFRSAVLRTQTEVKTLIRRLSDRISVYEEALMDGMRGILHPSFISLKELRIAFDQIKTKATKQGMKVVPFSLPIESIFARPVTLVATPQGTDWYISIPITSLSSNSYKLLQVTAIPFFNKHVCLEYELEPGWLAVSDDRQLHAHVTAADLITCDLTSDVYLCPRPIFHKTPRTCIAALALGTTEQVVRLCKKTVTKQSVYVQQNDTMYQIWARIPITMSEICIGENQPAKLVQGQISHPIRANCHLSFPDFVVYPLVSLEKVDLMENQQIHDIDLILGGHQLEELQDALDQLTSESDRPVEFESIEALWKKQEFKPYQQIYDVTTFASVLIVYISLFAVTAASIYFFKSRDLRKLRRISKARMIARTEVLRNELMKEQGKPDPR